MASSKIERIYTDGACAGNPGPGGWGTVIYFADGMVHELGGGDPQTTNNRMEMQAAVSALEFFAASGQTTPIVLYTDSEYLRKGVTQWLAGWKRKGWKTATGKPVLNQDLWEALDRLNSPQVEWQYVRGHSGDPGNERCDEIARAFSQGRNLYLQQRSLDRTDAEASQAEASPADVSQAKPQQQEASSPEASVSQLTITALTEPAPSPESSPENAAPSFKLSESPAAWPTMNAVSLATGQSMDLKVRLEMLQMADEIADRCYLITSIELAQLVQLDPATIDQKNSPWIWRNWQIDRVTNAADEQFWQLQRL
ncbi:ribonuclease HI [Alkalinema pantanalense CENA528]|uniref:ribonuclease HI n=1 Tax=Alkalinema pantanalense TaxID=1620705 RepID=UPI003D6E87CE